MYRKYCVYEHIRNDNNAVFYIGKGTRYRPYSKNSRNRHWWNIVKKHGYTVNIVYDNLTDDESFGLEQALIKVYGFSNLSNMVSGGRGACNRVVSDETRKRIGDANRRPNLKLRETMADPVRKELNRAITKLAMNRPEVKEKRSAVLRVAFNRPELVERTKRRLFKKVIDTQSGIVYESAQQASDISGINYSSLVKKLNGGNLNNTPYEYLDNPKSFRVRKPITRERDALGKFV